MKYRINVCRRPNATSDTRIEWEHFFKVDVEGPLPHEAKRVLTELIARFDGPDFKIDVVRWETVGHPVDLDEFLKD